MRKIAFFVFILYIALLIKAAEVSIIKSESIASHPANKRPVLYSLRHERGRILSSDGKILAMSAAKKGVYERMYPYGPEFAHITGYFSVRYGASFAEASFNKELSGLAKESYFSDFSEEPKDIRLSVSTKLQRKAFSLLKQKGAIAAIEVKTGRILCLVSYPTFDPNRIDEEFEKLRNDTDAPLINRVTSGLYSPGSTFKVFTLASYLESGGSLNDVFEAPSVLKVGGFRITNYGQKGYGKIDVAKAFALSVNTVFAQMALKIGPREFQSYWNEFGFSKKTGVELPERISTISKDLNDPVVLAWSSVGQAGVSVTPLKLLAFVSAVGNRGILIKPTILDSVNPATRKRILSEETASQVRKAMFEVVNYGTGKKARVLNMSVAGKTGTAEVEGKKPHAWFVGFAPAEDPDIAVVVLLENAGSGGEKAAPLFKQIVEHYFYGR